MPYIEDGEPAPVLYGQPAGEARVAIGWLDAAHPFTHGAVTPQFVRKLRAHCRLKVVNKTRGKHGCTLCPHEDWIDQTGGAWVTMPYGPFAVGNGEIHVTGRSGTRYSAPDMVIHYVQKHRYRPPDDFIEGVLGAPTPWLPRGLRSKRF